MSHRPNVIRVSNRAFQMPKLPSIHNAQAGASIGQRPRRGVTMVESMLVMVVLGTMLSIALPKMNDSARQRRLISAANALNADLPVAFSLAARQRKPVTLSYDAASGEIRVADRARPDTVYLRRPLLATSEYLLDSVTVSPSSVQLLPNGVSSAAFTVRLYNGRFTRQVTMARSGFTRVTVP
jgi:prepilin-type N-terminal cleavage/methylation domain-containing protein